MSSDKRRHPPHADRSDASPNGRPSEAATARGELPVMQRENERDRVAVDGRRTDDDDRCKLVVIHETAQTWTFYPHGVARFGVRVARPDAAKVAEFLDGAR